MKPRIYRAAPGVWVVSAGRRFAEIQFWDWERAREFVEWGLRWGKFSDTL